MDELKAARERRARVEGSPEATAAADATRRRLGNPHQQPGHVSPETAYMIDDYPYGRRLRCRKRVWVETKPRHGQRRVDQTENPKTGRWNKPKASTYSAIVVLVINPENGHLESRVLSNYATGAEVLSFGEAYGADFDEQQREAYRVQLARANVMDKVTWTVSDPDPTETREDREARDKAARTTINRAIAGEYVRLRREGIA